MGESMPLKDVKKSIPKQVSQPEKPVGIQRLESEISDAAKTRPVL